jgi:hypothetical protein
MQRLLLSLAFLIFPLLISPLSAQRPDCTLKGVVTAPDGLPVPLASIEVRNSQTGTVTKAVASTSGEYSVTHLPPGSYDVSATSIRYLAPFSKKSVSLTASNGPQRLDIRFGYMVLGGTPGEGHEAALSSLRRVAPKGPTPRMADGKPDLSGVWSWPLDMEKGNPNFLPAGAPDGSLTPATYCLPHAVLWNNQFVKLVQTPKLIVVLYDDDDPAYRQIYLDGRAHPKNEDPTWYGHAVGHWEKDTLVVDRVGFNGKGWLDPGGHRYSEKLHVIERYTRPDLGHLEVETTMEDPTVMSGPWTVKRLSILAPEEDVREYPCNENNVDPAHMKK